MNNENTPLAPPRPISLGPNDYAEKYDVGFKFPSLNEKGKKKLKFKIETGGKPITPVAVMRSTTRGYVIIDGWERYQIAKELQMGCPANLYEGISPEQVQDIFLSENLSKRQMKRKDKKELGFNLRQYASLNNADIARLLGVTPSTVSKWFNPKERPNTVEGMAKLRLEIDKIQREIGSYYFENICRQPLEKRKLAQNFMSALLESAYSLVDSVEKLSENTYEDVGEATNSPALKASGDSIKTLKGKIYNTLLTLEEANEIIGIIDEHFREDRPLLRKDRPAPRADNPPIFASHEDDICMLVSADAEDKPNAPDIASEISLEKAPAPAEPPLVVRAYRQAEAEEKIYPNKKRAGKSKSKKKKPQPDILAYLQKQQAEMTAQIEVKRTAGEAAAAGESVLLQQDPRNRPQMGLCVLERTPSGFVPSLDTS